LFRAVYFTEHLRILCFLSGKKAILPIQCGFQFTEEVPFKQAKEDGIILLLLLDRREGIVGSEAIAVGPQRVDGPEIVLAIGSPLQVEGIEVPVIGGQLKLGAIRTDIRDPLLNWR